MTIKTQDECHKIFTRVCTHFLMVRDISPSVILKSFGNQNFACLRISRFTIKVSKSAFVSFPFLQSCKKVSQMPKNGTIHAAIYSLWISYGRRRMYVVKGKITFEFLLLLALCLTCAKSWWKANWKLNNIIYETFACMLESSLLDCVL